MPQEYAKYPFILGLEIRKKSKSFRILRLITRLLEPMEKKSSWPTIGSLYFDVDLGTARNRGRVYPIDSSQFRSSMRPMLDCFVHRFRCHLNLCVCVSACLILTAAAMAGRRKRSTKRKPISSGRACQRASAEGPDWNGRHSLQRASVTGYQPWQGRHILELGE